MKILIKKGPSRSVRDFDVICCWFHLKILIKKGPSWPVRGPSPDGPGGTPDEDVALTHREGVKFLAGINHNTPFVFIHDINNMYGMLISCKALHCPQPEQQLIIRY